MVAAYAAMLALLWVVVVSYREFGGGAPLEEARPGVAHKSFSSMNPASSSAAEPDISLSNANSDPTNHVAANFEILNLGGSDTAGAQPMLRTTVQQRITALRPVYHDLILDLGMTEDEAERFLRLVDDKKAGSFGMVQGPSDDASLNQAVKAASDELLTLLGPERYQRYEQYEASLPDRSVLRGLNEELRATARAPLTDQQQQELLAMLSIERAVMPPIVRTTMSGDGADEYAAAMKAYRARVLEGAQFILTDEQLDLLRSRFERSKLPAASKDSNR